LQCRRTRHPPDRARPQEPSLCRFGWRRRALGSHCLAHRNLQDERRRPRSLSTLRVDEDRRQTSDEPHRRTTAIRLRADGGVPCGLTTPLTLILDNFAKSLDAIVGEGGGFSAIDIVNPQLPVFGLEL